MLIASAISPNRLRASGRYSQAYKRYIYALYNSEIKGNDPVIKAKVSLIIEKVGPDGWTTSYEDKGWITVKNDYYGDEKCSVMIDKAETRSQVSRFFMEGWKRKAGIRD